MLRAPTPRHLVAVSLVAVVTLAGCSDDDSIDLSGPAEVDGATDTTSTGSSVGVDGSGADVASGDLAEVPTTTLPAGAVGGGTVTVGGVVYDIEPTTCISATPNVAVEGVATAPDGTVAWILLQRTVRSRDDLVGILDQQTLDALFADRVTLDDIVVSVEVGSSGPTDDPDPSAPSWQATTVVGGATDVEVEATDTGVRGSGTATDIAHRDDGITAPIEFDVGCA